MEEDFKTELERRNSQEKLARKILGVRKSASLKEIKSVYHILALENHPDKKSKDRENYKKFLNINNAYKVLMGDSAEIIKDDEITTIPESKYDLSNSWGYYNHWKEQFGGDGTF